MSKNWKERMGEIYPGITERGMRRVPLDETPEELVNEIDPSLSYAGWEGGGCSNRLFKVIGPNGRGILKISSAPARIETYGHKEHRLLKRLTEAKVTGIPKAIQFYNSCKEVSGRPYNPEKLSAVLREFVEGTEFDAQFREPKTYDRLVNLMFAIGREAQIGLPQDFRSDQIIVDLSGQPHLIDLEEASGPDYKLDFEKIEQLRRYNIQAKLEKLPGLRLIDKVGNFLELGYLTSGLARAFTFIDPLEKPYGLF
jgi:hypothetical protein